MTSTESPPTGSQGDSTAYPLSSFPPPCALAGSQGDATEYPLSRHPGSLLDPRGIQLPTLFPSTLGSCWIPCGFNCFPSFPPPWVLAGSQGDSTAYPLSLHPGSLLDPRGIQLHTLFPSTLGPCLIPRGIQLNILFPSTLGPCLIPRGIQLNILFPSPLGPCWIPGRFN